MTKSLASVLEDARSLPPADQLTLLMVLLEGVTPAKSDAEILTDEVRRELDRRIDFCDLHPEGLIPMEEAHELIRQRMRARRGV